MLAGSIRHLMGSATALLMICTAARVLEAQQPPKAPPNVTAVGCISMSQDTAAAPPTGHEQGAAKGLTLTRSTLKASDEPAVGAPSRSAVPGSVPNGAGSGTTDAAVTRQPAPAEQSYWLVGAKSAELTRFIDRRVEVTGPFDQRLTANPGTPPSAHPSAPSRAISVLSFRVLDEGCS